MYDGTTTATPAYIRSILKKIPVEHHAALLEQIELRKVEVQIMGRAFSQELLSVVERKLKWPKK